MWAAPGVHGATERDSRQPYPRPSKPGPGKSGPGNPGRREARPRPPRPGRPGPGKPDASEPGPNEPGPSEPGPSEPGPSEPGPSEPGCPRAARGMARSSDSNGLVASHVSAALALVSVGKEKLLSVDFLSADRFLPFARDEPVNEGLAQILLHVWVVGRIDQDYAVLIEEALVTLHRDLQIGLVLERNPGAPVGQHVGAHGPGRV